MDILRTLRLTHYIIMETKALRVNEINLAD